MGTCAKDGARCFCFAGYAGESCAVPPPALRPGRELPGYVLPLNVQVYRVALEDYKVDDEYALAMHVA